MSAQEITARIEQVKTYIQDCERRITKGEVIPLVGLDKNVEDICNDIGELPENEAAGMEEKLSGLIGALDKLVAAIRNFESETDGDEKDTD
ncbi:MAG: hypothetical protein HND56_12565 [Pseudomonadota bacterium]|jgi:hypothetical protein|nr:hypothetical protein [Pseudomonadota bacterium]QKK06460.1 MAG: hypothetical protein HND56_12565 [Pseudomonadota bacterium]